MLTAAIFLTLSAVPSPICEMEQVLPPQTVAPANQQAFTTPLAYADGALYTVQIEPDPQDDTAVGLDTFVLKGQLDGRGNWLWTRKLIEPETMDDPWHTAGSIGVDEAGYIHVAYNVHNTPWQYAVSKRPGDISAFEFRGQPISRADKKHQTDGNGAPPGYDRYGDAAIPGAQISYPAFFNDRKGRLYITYRQTLRPARDWKDRALAGGVARYSAETRQWNAVGGRVPLKPDDAVDIPAGKPWQNALMFQPGWTVYFVRLSFDKDNGMHLSWLWRKGGPGRDSQLPSYAYSPAGSDRFYAADGRELTLPISLSDADLLVPRTDKRKFLSQTDISVDHRGRPVVLARLIDGAPVQFAYEGSEQGWIESQDLPGGTRAHAFTHAAENESRHWIFASGPLVFRRSSGGEAGQAQWRRVAEGSGYCGADVLGVPARNLFFMRTSGPGGCQSESEAIFKVPMCTDRL